METIGVCWLCLTEMCGHPVPLWAKLRHEPGATPPAITLVSGTGLCGFCALGKARQIVQMEEQRVQP